MLFWEIKWSRIVLDSPRYMGMQSELDCWMLWIENSMADSAFDMPVIDDFDEFQGGKQSF